MREIKYRCWIERYKEFKYWGFIDGQFINPPTGSGMSIEDCKKYSQQYAGHTDSNGKEIYEGDIDDFNWVVSFEQGIFCLKQSVNAKTFIPLSQTTVRAITGHIYETH